MLYKILLFFVYFFIVKDIEIDVEDLEYVDK